MESSTSKGIEFYFWFVAIHLSKIYRLESTSNIAKGEFTPGVHSPGSHICCLWSLQIKNSLLRRGLLQSRLGKKAPAARGGWEEGKIIPSSHRPPRPRFLSLALPLPFLSLVFTNRSLCGGERNKRVLYSTRFRWQWDQPGEKKQRNFTAPTLFSATLTFGKGCLRLIAMQLADLKREI